MSDEEEVFDAVVYYSANATFRLTEKIRKKIEKKSINSHN